MSGLLGNEFLIPVVVLIMFCVKDNQSRVIPEIGVYLPTSKPIFKEKTTSTSQIVKESLMLIGQNNENSKREFRSNKRKNKSEENETSNEKKKEKDASAPSPANDFSYQISNSVNVTVYLRINEVTDVDENTEIITMVISGNIQWNTTNLNINKNHFDDNKVVRGVFVANQDFFQKIWKPNIKFQQNANPSKHTQAFITEPFGFFYYEEDQEIEYHFNRKRVKLKCDMDFKYYPADIQHCDFTIDSLYSNRIVLMKWSKVRAYSINDNNFQVQLTSYEGQHKADDSFRILKFTMSMRREITYHVVQTYLPSVLYILITCLCFLVPSHMIEVRIGISMTTLLTLTAMFASVRESTPTVSYIKAIDIWMAFCIFFVFLTLLEFTTLLYLRTQREMAEKKRTENQRMLNALKGVIGGKSVCGPVQGLLERNFSVESLRYSRHERLSELVETYGFIVFSLVFLSFNVIYWSWLIEASSYYKWQINNTLNLKNTFTLL